jgi:hypothetical protein
VSSRSLRFCSPLRLVSVGRSSPGGAVNRRDDERRTPRTNDENDTTRHNTSEEQQSHTRADEPLVRTCGHRAHARRRALSTPEGPTRVPTCEGITMNDFSSDNEDAFLSPAASRLDAPGAPAAAAPSVAAPIEYATSRFVDQPAVADFLCQMPDAEHVVSSPLAMPCGKEWDADDDGAAACEMPIAD